ncbi:MAG: hypothetical protein WEB30_08830 [Cyclobacteriaceae bacterium]
MTLSQAATNILNQLADLVKQIHENDFQKPSEILNGSTVGQHIRHTVEFFLCFESGYNAGLINYDKRPHDKLIESDKHLALTAIHQALQFVRSLEEDKPLTLEVGYDLAKEEFVEVDTNANRELVYNIEHAVHHMAIIKIGIQQIAPYIKVERDFGIAASTVRYASAGGSNF